MNRLLGGVGQSFSALKNQLTEVTREVLAETTELTREVLSDSSTSHYNISADEPVGHGERSDRTQVVSLDSQQKQELESLRADNAELVSRAETAENQLEAQTEKYKNLLDAKQNEVQQLRDELESARALIGQPQSPVSPTTNEFEVRQLRDEVKQLKAECSHWKKVVKAQQTLETAVADEGQHLISAALLEQQLLVRSQECHHELKERIEKHKHELNALQDYYEAKIRSLKARLVKEGLSADDPDDGWEDWTDGGNVHRTADAATTTDDYSINPGSSSSSVCGDGLLTKLEQVRTLLLAEAEVKDVVHDRLKVAQEENNELKRVLEAFRPGDDSPHEMSADELREQLSLTLQTVVSLKERNAQLSESVVELDKQHQLAMEQLLEAKQMKEMECGAVSAQLATISSECDGALRRVAQLEQENAELTHAYNELNDEYERATADSRGVVETNRELGHRLDALKGDLIEYEEKYERCKSENARAMKQLEALNVDFDRLKTELSNARSNGGLSNKYMQDEVNRLNTQLEESLHKREELLLRVQDVQGTLSSFEAKIGNLQAANDALTGEKEQLQSQLQQTQNTLAHARDREPNVPLKLCEKEAEIRNLKDEHANLIETLNYTEKSMYELKEREMQVSALLEHKTQRCTELEQLLHEQILQNSEWRRKVDDLRSSEVIPESSEAIASLNTEIARLNRMLETAKEKELENDCVTALLRQKSEEQGDDVSKLSAVIERYRTHVGQETVDRLESMSPSTANFHLPKLTFPDNIETAVSMSDMPPGTPHSNGAWSWGESSPNAEPANCEFVDAETQCDQECNVTESAAADSQLHAIQLELADYQTKLQIAQAREQDILATVASKTEEYEKQQLLAKAMERSILELRDVTAESARVSQLTEDENRSLRENIAAMQEQLQTTTGEVAALKASLDSCRAELEQSKSDMQQYYALAMQKHEESLRYYDELQRVLAERANIAGNYREVSTLTDENLQSVALTSEQVALKESRILTLTSQLQNARMDLEATKTELETKQVEVTTSLQRLASLKDEKVATVAEAEHLRKNLTLLQQQLQSAGENATQRQELDLLRTELAVERERSEKLSAEMQAIIDQDARQSKELQRLRAHLLTIEENYTQEAVKYEKCETELRERLSEAEQRCTAASDSAKYNNRQLLQEAENLRTQLSNLASQRDAAVLEASEWKMDAQKNARALQNLQQVLQHFQQERDSRAFEEVDKYKRELALKEQSRAALEQNVKQFESELAKAGDALKAASGFSKEMEAKNAQVDELRHQVEEQVSDNAKLQARIAELQKVQSGKIDKDLLKNLLLGYFTAPAQKKPEVAHLLGSVLDFTDEQFKKVEGGSSGWLDFMKFRSAQSGGSALSSENSIAQQFISFLEKESAPKHTLPMPIHADSIAAQSSRSSTPGLLYSGSSSMGPTHSVAAHNLELPTFTPATVRGSGSTENTADLMRELLKQ